MAASKMRRDGPVLSSIPVVGSVTQAANNGKLLRKPIRRQIALHEDKVGEAPETSIESPPRSPSLGVDNVSPWNSTARGSPAPPPTETAASPTKFKKESQATTIGITLPGSTRQLKPTEIRGPDPLPPPPPRVKRIVPSIVPFLEMSPSEIHYELAKEREAEAPIMHFVRAVSNMQQVPVSRVEKIIYSKHNFKKLTMLVSEMLQREAAEPLLTVKDMSSEIPISGLPHPPSNFAVAGGRIPQRQLLLQMAALLASQVRKAAGDGKDVRASIRALPKYDPAMPIADTGVAHTEIVLYEVPKEQPSERPSVLVYQKTAMPPNNILVQAYPATHFMDSQRTRSPFSAVNADITPDDVALLDALLCGGTVLSLKAHFVSKMPDITPLLSTLKYINLSYNNFTEIPFEVLFITSLEVLKLRNNPIREIPDQISRLQQLRTLEVSFCLISHLPSSLFQLKALQYLDVSYNKLLAIPSEVCHLRNLQVLFVEGNQLIGLPCSVLTLPRLTYIRVRNNFMHPLLWPDYMHIIAPQRLVDLAALAFKQLNLDRRYGDSLPGEANSVLKSAKKCDCCQGPSFGPGLRLIRPGSIYGVRNVPFVFHSCSPYCARLFMGNNGALTDFVQYEGSIDDDSVF